MPDASADLFNLSPLPSWLCDYQTTRIIRVNRSALQSFGYTEKQWSKIKFEDIFLPQSDYRTKFNGSYSLLTQTGSRVSVKLSATTIVYNQKDCWLVVAYPEASGRLPATESEQIISRLSEAMRFSKMGLAELTLATQEVYVSPELLELLEDVVNINVSMSLPEFMDTYIVEEDRPLLHAKIREGIGDGTKAVNRITAEVRVQTAKGNIKSMEVRGTFLQEGIGVGIFQDITERREREREMSKLALIASHTSNAVFFTDQQGLITWVNKGFERLTGYSFDEIIGKKTDVLLGPLTDMSNVHALQTNVEQGKSFRTELLHYTKSGTSFWVDLEVMPMYNNTGTLTGFMSIESDITVLKTAIQEMLLSEELLSAFVKNAPVIVFLKDLKGRYSFSNDLFVKCFTKEKSYKAYYTDDDLLPKLVSELHGVDQEIFSSGESKAFELSLTENNQEDTYYIIKFPLKNLQGEIYSLGGVALTLTARKRAEQSLVESEQRYRSIVNDQNELICRYKRGGILTFVNKAYARTFGKTIEELTGKSFYEFVPPESLSKVQQYVDAIFDERIVPRTNEYRTLVADESYRWIEWFDFPMRNAEGYVTEIQAIGHDITHRKKLEAEQARLDKIVRESYNEVYLFNTETLQFEYANASALRNIGYNLPELLSMKFSDLFYYPDKMALRALLGPLRRGDTDRVHLQIKYTRKDATHYDVDAVIQLLEGSFVAIATDITHKLNTEKKLIASVLEKETLVKEIHHRVKNNLQLISSILYIKLMSLAKSDVRDFLENTRLKIHSIALIHERLLQSNTLDKIEISDYLGKLIYDLHSTHSQQYLALEIKSDIQKNVIDLDTAIYCGMIINELITNSMKHAFHDRSSGIIIVSLKKHIDCYILSVADNGTSMPDYIVPEKAESFGMQLLQIFVKQLKGSVEIIREKGTKFQVKFTHKL